MIHEPRRNAEIMLNITRAGEDAQKGVFRAFHRLGSLNVKQTRKYIRKGPKTGRLYRIKGRNRRHRASAKGQSPANLFGNLARSIGFQISGPEMQFATYGDINGEPVQTYGVSYGQFLENIGRPFLSRTVKANESFAESLFNDEILKAIK